MLTDHSARSFHGGDSSRRTPTARRAMRRRSRAPSSRRTRLEPLEPRLVLSTTNSDILAGPKVAILDGLAGLVEWADEFENHSLVGAVLPVIGQSLGTSLDLSEALQTGLVEPIEDFFTDDLTPTTDELVAAIKALDGTFGDLAVTVDDSLVMGGLCTDAAGSELSFHLVFAATRTLTSGLSLGPRGDEQGLRFDASGSVALTVGLNFDVTFGFDLAGGLAPEDAFFIRVADLSASADATATGLSGIGFNAGFFDATASGSLSLAADLDVTVNNPDSDAKGNITLAELIETDLAALVSLAPSGSASGSLTLAVSAFGGFVPALSPTISFTSTNPFAAPELVITNLDEVRPFTYLSSTSWIGLLGQVGTWLGDLGESSILDAAIHLVGTSLGEALQLDDAWLAGLVGKLVHPAGSPLAGLPTFDSAQSFATALETVLGLTPGEIAPTYNGTTHELTYHLEIDHAFGLFSLPLDLDFDLGSFVNFSTTADVNFDVDVGLELTLGIDLDDFVAQLVATGAAPANGKLTDDAEFALSLAFGAPVAVTAPKTSTDDNDDLDDLVGDINAALGTAGLAGKVIAGRDAMDVSRLTLTTAVFGPVISLQILASPSDPTATQLKFDAGDLAIDPGVSHLFVEDAALTATAALSVTDFDASADFGYLAVNVVDGDGTASFSVSLDLADPATSTAGGRVYLNELFAAIASDITDIIDGPDLAGSLDVTLPVQAVILGLPTAGDPNITIAWPDIFTGAPDIDFNNWEDLFNFEHLSDEQIFTALGSLGDFLRDLQNFSLYDVQIPGLNVSLGEVFDYATEFLALVDELLGTPNGKLNELEIKIEDALGLADSALELAMVDDNKVLRVDLLLADTFSTQLPVNLDLDSLGLEELGNILDIHGSALLSATAGVDFELDFGIDLTDPPAPKPFLYETTGLTLSAQVAGTDIDFTTAIGPIGAFIKDGSLLVDGDGNAATTADRVELELGLTDESSVTAEGKIPLDAIDFDNVELTLAGQVHATLPVFFPVESVFQGNITLAITDLGDIENTTTLDVPDFDVDFEDFDLLNNLGVVLDGIDFVLGGVQDMLEGEVFGIELPLIGDKLADAADFVEDIRTGALAELRARFQEANNKTPEVVRQGLFDALGPDGLDILGDRDGNSQITTADIAVAQADLDNDGQQDDQFDFDMILTKQLAVLDEELDFDLGLPGLGLEVEGSVEVGLGFTWQFGFGISREYGFYFDTATENELAVGLSARIPDFHAEGQLMFLQLDVSDEDADGNPGNIGVDVDQDEKFPSAFLVGLTVDFLDPIDDDTTEADNGKLTFDDLASGGFDIADVIDASLAGSADVNLDLITSFRGDARFPSISAELAIHWPFATTDADLTGGEPTVAFNNVRLNVGEFVSEYATPVLNAIHEVTKPIDPIIDFLNTPVPVLSSFGEDITPLTLIVESAQYYGYPVVADFIEAVVKIVDVINNIPDVSDQISIPLGSFNIIGTDVRDEDEDLSDVEPNITDTVDPREELEDADDGAFGFLEDLEEIGIFVPILTDPASIFRLLMGQTVDLLLYDMPKLEFEVQLFPIKIGPIIPPYPIFASIAGFVGAGIDLDFGFDTHGLELYRETGDALDIFSGFFISDRENPDGTGDDKLEAFLSGRIDAGVEVSLVVVSAGVSGGVGIELGADLVDTNDDGKIHLDEFLDNIERGVTCTFDLAGEIYVQMSAYVELLFHRFSFSTPRITLVDFVLTDEDCFPDRFDGNDSGAGAGGSETYVGVAPGIHMEGMSLESASDVDWYEFTLLHEDSIDVNVRHSNAKGDLSLEVYDAAGTLLGHGQSQKDGEIVKLQDLAAGNYRARVSGDSRLNNYKLIIEPGRQSDTRVIYVSREDGHNKDESYYTWTTGDDANDGLSASQPKASLQSVLDAYDLGPNDLIVFDTGVYTASAVIMPADGGATYVGTVDGSYLGPTTLNGADENVFYLIGFGDPDDGGSPVAPTAPGSSPIPAHVMLVDSDDNVFDRVTFNTPILNVSLERSDRNLFQNDTFSGNSGGIQLGYGGADDVQENIIRYSEFSNSGTSLRIVTHAHNSIHDNTITGPGGIGIDIAPGVTSLVTGNDVSGRDVGIYSDSTVVDMYGNHVHDNTIGMASRQGAIGPDNPPPFGAPGGKTPDKVYNNDTGVLIHEDAAGVVLRFTEIYENDFGVEALGDRSRIIANDVHDNGIGIRGSEVIGPEAWETGLSNRVHHNDVGIETLRGAEARYNHVYLNVTGVKISGNSFVHHNLIYRNTGHGALISGTSEPGGAESGHGLLFPGVTLDGNTIYAPGGNGIHLQGFLRNVRIRNNIVLAESGYALYVSPESQLDPETGLAAYSSDYNDYFATGGGKVAFQGKDFVDLFDWQVEAESDLHSLGRTSIDPLRDDPLFVSVAADDYRVLAGSPTVDAGDPTSAFAQEPGPNGNRVNLGAYGNTPQATVSPASWLRITYPEFYVDLRSPGAHAINWETYNVAAGVNLKIELIEEVAGTVRTISASTPAAAGTFTWNPSTLFTAAIRNNGGRRHRVRLTTLSGPVLTDSTREPFAIVDFNPVLPNIFYVDDASNAGDGWSPAVAGNNRNTGLAAGGVPQPKASIRALVLSYPMGTNGTLDSLWIDTGDYVHAVNVNLRRTPLSFDPRMNTVQLTFIAGPENGAPAPRIDRANPYAGSVAIDLADAPNMILTDMEILGAHIGIRVRDNSDNLAADQLILHDHAADGLSIEEGSDGADLDVLEVYDNGRHGIFVDSRLDHIRQAKIYDNGQTGIALRSVGAAVIENSEIYCTLAPGKLCQTRGIDIINPGATTATVGHLDLLATRGNKVHHNAQEGIFASGNVLVAGNTVHDNNIYGVRLDDGADARVNAVHHHNYGISARGSTSDIVANRVYINDVTAIEASLESNVQRNVVYTNQLHGIHGIEFSGLMDHNLVYSTGSNPVHIQGPGRGAEFVNNTVYERCVVNDEPPPHVGPAVMDAPWDWFTQIIPPPPHLPFTAVPWGTARIEFGQPTDGGGGTFNLGSGGGHDARTPEPVPPGPEWTIPYIVTSLDMAPMENTPLGPMHVRLYQPSGGVLSVQNIGGSLAGETQLTLFVEISFPQQDGLILRSEPIVVGMEFGPTAGFDEFEALQMVLPIAQQSPPFPAALRNVADPPEAPPWGGWRLNQGHASPMNQQPEQDRGQFCPEVGVLVSTNSRDVYFRNNIIYVEGDATIGIPPEAISVDVEVRSDSITGWDSDFNVLMTEHGIVGVFNGTPAGDIPAWQGVTGDDDFAINASLASMWVDPDGLDGTIGGLNGFDDNFHLNSTTSHATSGALAPVIDEAAGGTGLPVFAPVAFGSGAIQSPAIDQGDPDFVYAFEPDLPPQENGQLRNAAAYGDTDQASGTPAEFVQVIYPLGTEDLAHGRTYQIRWRSHDDPASPTVTIELRGSAGSVEEIIAVAAPNTGSLPWTVPPAGPAGEAFPGVPDGDYVIVVRRASSLSPGEDVVGSSRRTFTIGAVSSGPIVLRAAPEPIAFETAIKQFGMITLVYSDNMSPATATDATNYELRWAGPNGAFGDLDDVTYTPTISYSSSGTAADIATAMLDFGGVVFPEGNYRFTARSSVTSLTGVALDGDNDGVAGGNYVRTFTVDQTPPTVSIVPISPDPRNSAPAALNIVFSEPVIGFGLADVRLLLERPIVPAGATPGTVRNLFDAGNSLITTSDGGITWTVSDVNRLMEEEGIYYFSLTAANSSITDLAGNPLVVNAIETWEMDTTPPVADILAVTPDPRSTPVSAATIVFDEPVVNFTFGSLALSRAGQPIPLSAANNPTTTDNRTWIVPNLGGLTAAEGPYTLKVLIAGGHTDVAGNSPGIEVRETWLVYTTPPAADILDVTPDPRNTPTSAVTIVFDRPVLNVDLGDLRLTRDGGPNLLPGGATLSTADNQYYTLGNLTGLTGAEGSYELRVVAAGSGIVDAAGNAMTTDASDGWAVDMAPPGLTIIPVTPDPRNTAVDQVTFEFTEVVSGVDLGDLTLTLDGGPNLFTDEQTLTTADGRTWTVGNLASITTAEGEYQLMFVAAGSGITDAAGNALAAGASRSWVMDTTAPTVSIVPVAPDPRAASVTTMSIVFSERVTGLDIADLSLRRDGGGDLLSAAQTLATSDSITYTLQNLGALTAASGAYELSLAAFLSNIRDAAGNSLFAGGFDTWTTDATPPTVDIVDATPDPRVTPVDAITLVFSEPINGFELADLLLSRNAGPNLLTGGQTLVTSDNITFTLGNLAGVTAPPGDYVLTLAAAGSGIADGLGNALAAGAADAWRTVLVGDFNADFVIGGLDLHILQTHLGTASGATHFDGDMNGDGAVGRIDAALFTMAYGQSAAAPPPPVPSPAPAASRVDSARVPAAWRLAAEARRPARAASVLSSAAVDRVLETSAIAPKSSVFAGPTLRARRHVRHDLSPTSTTAK